MKNRKIYKDINSLISCHKIGRRNTRSFLLKRRWLSQRDYPQILIWEDQWDKLEGQDQEKEDKLFYSINNNYIGGVK